MIGGEQTKECLVCGATFYRHNDYSNVQWASCRFCSKTCAIEQSRRTRRAKRRCKDCGSSGPFNTYKTTSGRISQHSRCVSCQNEARRPKRKTETERKKCCAYAKKFRDKHRIEAPYRLTHSKAWRAKNPEKYLFFRMGTGFRRDRVRRARTITYEQFIAEIGGKMPEICPVFGLKFDLLSPPKSDCLPTVDRIDSSKPYEVGNIAIISWKANIIKNAGTADEHRRIADWIDSLKRKK